MNMVKLVVSLLLCVTLLYAKDEYLIICEDRYSNNSDLLDFISYREDEFSVILKKASDLGRTTSELYSAIKDRYTSSGENLQYLLFVGNMRNFPSYGVAGENKNAPSFFQYGCMDDEFNDYYPDIHVGLWSVHGEEQLANIVAKTIHMDSMAAMIPNSVTQYSTWASKPYVSQMEKLNYLLNQGLWKRDTYWSAAKFDVSTLIPDVEAKPVAVYGPTLIEQINGNEPPKIIVYQGHGDGEGGWVHPDLKDPAFKYHDQIAKKHLADLTNSSVYPSVWSFACNTGNFTENDTSFAEVWIGIKHGAVTFIGSTNVSSNGQQTLDVGMTSAIANSPEANRIGQIFDLGKAFMFDSAAVVDIPQHPHIGEQQARNTARMYQLFGDPALKLYVEGGVPSVSSAEHHQHIITGFRTIENRVELSFSGFETGSITLFTLMGKEVYRDNFKSKKTLSVMLNGLSKNIYILHIRTAAGIEIQQIRI